MNQQIHVGSLSSYAVFFISEIYFKIFAASLKTHYKLCVHICIKISKKFTDLGHSPIPLSAHGQEINKVGGR